MPHDAELVAAIARSKSADTGERLTAIPELGSWLADPRAFQRLGEMLDDVNVTVEVDADYIAYLLHALDASGTLPILTLADSIAPSRFTPEARSGLAALRQL